MGKLIRNGIEYGGGNGTDIFEVTQAEYDALKQAGTLVHNALYVISDAPNLNPTASDIEYSSGVTVKQAIDDICNYSTTETAIGKWIDGRTVYQKVILINDTISNSWVDADTISGITRIVGAEFIVYEGGARGGGVRQGLFAEISLIDTDVVKIYNNTGYNIQVDYLILKYIKN